MEFSELIVTVCVAAQPSHCEERHFQLAWSGSLAQRTVAAPAYSARWTAEHPKWTAVRWRCDYPGKRET